MLAKKIKIRNIKQQKEYIMEQLEMLLNVSPIKDGDTAYPYVGHLFPEVKAFFEGEGFDVKRIESETLTTALKGRPVYLFTISDNVTLSAEEMEEAEKVEHKPTGANPLQELTEFLNGLKDDSEDKSDDSSPQDGTDGLIKEALGEEPDFPSDVTAFMDLF